MKKTLFFFAMLFTMATAFAQKEKLDIDYDRKTEIATVNGTPVFKIVRENNMGAFTYNIQNLEGKTLIIFKPVYYKDSRAVSQSNPHGSMSYHDIIFIDDQEIKADWIWLGMNQAVKLIYKNNLIKDGKVDLEAAKLFARVHGTVNYEKRMTAR